jgi:hypothetical protein
MTHCLIQPFKPSSCREWKPSLYRRECREGLVKYWQLTVSRSGQLGGAQEKLRDFHSFIESLMITERTDACIKPKPETEIKDKHTPFCAYIR